MEKRLVLPSVSVKPGMLAIDDFLGDIIFFTLAGAGSWFMGTFRLSTITTLVRGPADACDEPVAEAGLDLVSVKLFLHKWFLSRLGSCLRLLTKTSMLGKVIPTGLQWW